MAEIPAYDARFTFSRVFADCGRVIASAGLPLALGVLVLGVAPVMVASLPWWRGSSTTPADALRRVWLLVSLGKAAVDLLGLSAMALFVTAASLKVLVAFTWVEALQARRLMIGFATALVASLLANLPAMAAPVVVSLWPSFLVRALLGWAELAMWLLVIASIGLALPIAVAETAAPPTAMGRAFKLLAGLRWRVVAVGIAYLVASGICTALLGFALASIGLSPARLGVGLALGRIPTVLLGAINQVVFVSVYLQARRIADGPSAMELREVFA